MTQLRRILGIDVNDDGSLSETSFMENDIKKYLRSDDATDQIQAIIDGYLET